MDTIFESWLRRQAEDAAALTAASDIVRVQPEDARVPRRFVAEFACPTLVKTAAGVTLADRFAIFVAFPSDYLRVPAHPPRIVNVIAPAEIFHPNVRGPFICTGRIAPGTGLCQLLYQVHEILVYARFTPNENDALNGEACQWARAHADQFPLDHRPLRRRVGDGSIGNVVALEVSPAPAATGAAQ